MGILLAAEIVERMTGKPLDAFLQEEVFAPLKMRHSSMGIGHRNIADTVQCDLPSSGDLRMSAGDRDLELEQFILEKAWGALGRHALDGG